MITVRINYHHHHRRIWSCLSLSLSFHLACLKMLKYQRASKKKTSVVYYSGVNHHHGRCVTACFIIHSFSFQISIIINIIIIVDLDLHNRLSFFYICFLTLIHSSQSIDIFFSFQISIKIINDNNQFYFCMINFQLILILIHSLIDWPIDYWTKKYFDQNVVSIIIQLLSSSTSMSPL